MAKTLETGAAVQASEGKGHIPPQGEALSEENRLRLSSLCASRAEMYQLLSRLYMVEVDQALFDGLCDAAFPTGTGNQDVDEGYRLLATYCASQHDDPLLDLARDYAHVFIGHGNNAYAAAYPFESVYTSEKRLLMQEARDEVVLFYAQDGFEVGRGWSDPEDHVGVELQYLEIMARRTQRSLDESDCREALHLFGRQRSFLSRHLVSWIPILVNDMLRLAETDAYRGLALLTRGLLAEDLAFLTNTVSSEEPDTDGVVIETA